MLYRSRAVFRDILPPHGKIENTLQAFQLAINGRSFHRPFRIALGRLLPPVVPVLFDHLNGYVADLAHPEKRFQVGEIGAVSLEATGKRDRDGTL